MRRFLTVTLEIIERQQWAFYVCANRSFSLIKQRRIIKQDEGGTLKPWKKYNFKEQKWQFSVFLQRNLQNPGLSTEHISTYSNFLVLFHSLPCIPRTHHWLDHEFFHTERLSEAFERLESDHRKLFIKMQWKLSSKTSSCNESLQISKMLPKIGILILSW